MLGLTIMEISEAEMREVVQYYLNGNLLNTIFEEHHKSQVESVRQRKSGRFVIEFKAKQKATAVIKGATNAQTATESR